MNAYIQIKRLLLQALGSPKTLIRLLYWKYAHKGDKWQMRLMMYHMRELTRMDSHLSNGEFIIGQINRINGNIDLIAELRVPTFKGIGPLD
jgi:hypothetical protein